MAGPAGRPDGTTAVTPVTLTLTLSVIAVATVLMAVRAAAAAASPSKVMAGLASADDRETARGLAIGRALGSTLRTMAPLPTVSTIPPLPMMRTAVLPLITRIAARWLPWTTAATGLLLIP